MSYLYEISTALNYILLVLFFIRVLINKKNIDFKNSNFGWQVVASLLILSIVPMANSFLLILSAYLSLLTTHDNFIQFMNK